MQLPLLNQAVRRDAALLQGAQTQRGRLVAGTLLIES